MIAVSESMQIKRSNGISFPLAAERVSIQLQLSGTDPCGPPPQAASFAFIADYIVGALVGYHCMNGFVQQSGSEELACVRNDWEGESLICRSKYGVYTHALCIQVHSQYLYWQLQVQCL